MWLGFANCNCLSQLLEQKKQKALHPNAIIMLNTSTPVQPFVWNPSTPKKIPPLVLTGQQIPFENELWPMTWTTLYNFYKKIKLPFIRWVGFFEQA